jgi:hypothetical protein
MIILLLDTHFKHCLNIEELYHKGVDFKTLECPPVDLLEVIFDITGINKEKDKEHLKDEFAILFEKLAETSLDEAVPLYLEYYGKMEQFFPERKNPNLN